MLSLLGPDADWDERGLLVSMTVYPLVYTWLEHLGPGGSSLLSVTLKVVQVNGHATGAMESASGDGATFLVLCCFWSEDLRLGEGSEVGPSSATL